VIEGLNNKAKVTMRRSYGFRTYRILELALYHTLGKLPEPPVTHEILLTNRLFLMAYKRTQFITHTDCLLLTNLPLDNLPASFSGSAQESDSVCISGCFPENDEFGL
jgi:hypothetical protein